MTSEAYPDGEGDRAFLAAFEDRTLPRSEWTHRAHLRMAFLYLDAASGEASANDLLPTVRERIRAYNAVQGNPTGYHETITAAFLRLVAFRRLESPADSFAAFERENTDLFAPNGAVLLRYYNRETLFSNTARASFVEPDREPLPGPAFSPEQ